MRRRRSGSFEVECSSLAQEVTLCPLVIAARCGELGIVPLPLERRAGIEIVANDLGLIDVEAGYQFQVVVTEATHTFLNVVVLIVYRLVPRPGASRDPGAYTRSPLSST